MAEENKFGELRTTLIKARVNTPEEAEGNEVSGSSASSIPTTVCSRRRSGYRKKAKSRTLVRQDRDQND